jgi:hypothetical protein
MPEGLENNLKPKGVSIVTDVDDSNAPVAELPPPSKAGVIAVPKDKDGNPITDGQDPEDKEPPYMRTGWAPKMGWPKEDIHESESLLDHSTWLESKLPDKLYGGMCRETPPFRSAAAHSNLVYRLVSQYRNRYIRLPCLLAGGRAWRRTWLGVHRDGYLLDVLPHLDPTRSTQFPRRHQP